MPQDDKEDELRLFILFNSTTAGTYNKEMRKEFISLLDKLYKDKKIDKPFYKVMYHAFKNIMDRNEVL